MNFQVQFITHFTETLSYLDSVRIALEGGCRWIQLRMKDAPEDEVRAAAGKALPLCRQYGAVLILDDRVELVRECGADGVHLGLTEPGGSYPGENSSSEAPPILWRTSACMPRAGRTTSAAARSASPLPRTPPGWPRPWDSKDTGASWTECAVRVSPCPSWASEV